MIRAILKEYGLIWILHRILYSLKLKTLKKIPIFEKCFEKRNIKIKRIDIYDCKNIKNIETFLKNISFDEKRRIINEAEDILKGKINAFSAIKLDYGKKMEWGKNPITNKEYSLEKKWYKIPDFNEEIGDIKVIWEFSRMCYLIKLVRAYIINKDERYYLKFSEIIKSWINQNKYSYGPNYKCGQESSIRVLNLLIVSAIFKEYKKLTIEDEENIKKIVRDSYKKLYSNFYYAKNCIKNNHTISELIGLVVCSWCNEEDYNVKKYFFLLEKEIDRQFFKDGGYIQYSFNYQRMVLQLIEFIIQIQGKIKLKLSNKIYKKIENSILLMAKVMSENGNLPNYGSNDGSLIFPVTSCEYNDFRPTLNSLYYLLKGKKLFQSNKLVEEIYWFSNNEEKGIKKKKLENLEDKSNEFFEAGIYILKNNESLMMILLQEFKTRPSQMDQLHIDLWYKNINVLCDSGTYSYALDLGKKLSLTEAHNTIKISKREQMNKIGEFLIYDWTEVKEKFITKDSFIGSYKSKNGYIHKRVIQIKENEYRIIDTIEVIKNMKDEKVDVIFHTPCEIKILMNEIELYFKGNKICSIFTSDEKYLEKGIRSLYYLHKEEINIIRLRQNLKKKNEFNYVIKLY